MSSNIIDVTKANFDQIIEQHPLVLLDFWGQQCAPCHSFSAVLDKVAPDYPEVLFAKINTDQEKELTTEFEIRSLPFIMIMRENIVLYADSGLLVETSLREILMQVQALDMEEIKKQVQQHEK